MTEATPPAAYEHRAMRVKTDRTVTIGGRRYRPGEAIDGPVPEKHKDDFEEGVVAHTPPPAEGPRVQKIRHEPPVIIREPGLDKLKSAKDE